MIDILDQETDIALSIKDAVADIAVTSAPELIGRLVNILVASGTITANDLRRILPIRYEVRE